MFAPITLPTRIQDSLCNRAITLVDNGHEGHFPKLPTVGLEA